MTKFTTGNIIRVPCTPVKSHNAYYQGDDILYTRAACSFTWLCLMSYVYSLICMLIITIYVLTYTDPEIVGSKSSRTLSLHPGKRILQRGRLYLLCVFLHSDKHLVCNGGIVFVQCVCFYAQGKHSLQQGVLRSCCVLFYLFFGNINPICTRGAESAPLDVSAHASKTARRIFTKLVDFINNAPSYVYIQFSFYQCEQKRSYRTFSNTQSSPAAQERLKRV